MNKKKLLLFPVLFFWAGITFSQDEAGIHCTLKEGDELYKGATCKYYAYNRHNRAVIMVIKQTHENCDGTFDIRERTITVSAGQMWYSLYQDGEPCISDKIAKNSYSIISKTFKD